MILKSKIINILIIFLTVASLASCKKSKYDVIPDVYIDFYLDLGDPEFFDLTAPANYKIIESGSNITGYHSGYEGNGIIVYRTAMGDVFYAYDRTCPHDFAVNGLNVKVNVDFLNAICPKCSTSYSLEVGGTPISGPGRYPLKNYKTNFNGQTVRVWNSF